MNEGLPMQGTLFDAGPFPHFQKSLRLFRPIRRDARFRALIVILVGWVPLGSLIVLESLIRNNHTFTSFLADFGVHARSLLAAPLFLISEAICLPRLEKIANHFVDGGLVADRDRGRFDAAAASTGRLMNSTLAEIIAVVLAYSLIVLLLHYLPQKIFPLWYSPSGQGYPFLSWAGWWYAFISLPLLVIILLGWIWRVVLWGRFLFLMSRLELRLIPAHPDLAGGLKFLGLSLFAFMPVGFTIGMIAAGSVANQVVHGKVSLAAFQKPVFGLLIIVLVFFVGPLLIFVTSLREQIERGTFQYGALAHAVGEEFERKWRSGQTVGPETLAAPDFSATTDLYSIAANADQMRSLPFGVKNVILLIIVTLLPFLPVALMTIPLVVILKEVSALLF